MNDIIHYGLVLLIAGLIGILVIKHDEKVINDSNKDKKE